MKQYRETTVRKLDVDAWPGLQFDLLALRDELGHRHRPTITTMAGQRDWLASLDKDPHHPKNLVLMAERQVEGSAAIIGIFKIADIDYINRMADVGWDIFPRYRGRGFARNMITTGTLFAIEVLNLRRVTAEIRADNPASLASVRSVGYTHEGTKRACCFDGGTYVDSLIFSYIVGDGLR